EEAEEIKAGGVRPVQVLQEEHDWAPRRQCDKEVARLSEEGGPAGRTAETGHRWGACGVGEGADALGDLEPGTVGRGLDPVVAVAREDGNARVRGRAGEPAGEGGLADAGLAADQHQAAPAVARGSQAVAQDGEFAVAPDEWWCGRR